MEKEERKINPQNNGAHRRLPSKGALLKNDLLGPKRGENASRRQHLDGALRERKEEPRFTAQQVDPNRSKMFVEPKLRIIPLGGVEETGGKNCTVIEYKNDIVVVDMGFMFPDETMPGVDYVIPDVSYLEQNKHKIRGLVLTHGHLDHIGAIPYIYDRIGSPTIYSAPLTLGILKGKLEEFGLDRGAKLSSFLPGDAPLHLGCFKVTAFKLTHSIPQSMGFSIETPEGIVVITGDFKFDHTPADGKPTDFSSLAIIGSQKPLVLLSDSTNIEKPGVSVSEKEIEDRKVAFVGRSMIQTTEIAISLEALIVPKDTIIDVKDVEKFPSEKIVIVCTGSQGEDNAALTRIATGEHRQVKIKKDDLVILSSSPIPGNERSVSGLMDNLFRAGAKVVYQKLMDVHTSGHANQEDLKLMLALIKPKYFVPVHGERHKLMLHCQIAQEMGIVDEEHCLVPDDGQVIEFNKGKGEVTNKRVPASYVMVDGLGVGDVGNIVLRDRKAMAQDGIFVIIVTVDHATGEIATSPDIISRGFIYMRENEQLVHKARAEIKKIFTRPEKQGSKTDWSLAKQRLRDEIGDFLFRETERKPMVIPVIIEV